MNQPTLLTIDVSHGTTHDGPGMRTTVFVKGCPLRCAWCQNPESIPVINGVWWDKTLCIGCGSCKEACPQSAITFGEKGILIDREKCASCLSCADACPATAMSAIGKAYDADTLFKELMKDQRYYAEFGGGVTFSGGEPLLQAAFLAPFFERLHLSGITTALDTCGLAPKEALLSLLPHTDYLLYDMKLFENEAHKRFTGQSNDRIKENLLLAASEMLRNGSPKEIWIRTPLIPGATATEENIRAIGKFLKENLDDVVTRWELCAFNAACKSKYDKLERDWAFAACSLMTQRDVAPLRSAAEETFGKEKLIVTGMIKPE